MRVRLLNHTVRRLLICCLLDSFQRLEDRTHVRDQCVPPKRFGQRRPVPSPRLADSSPQSGTDTTPSAPTTSRSLCRAATITNRPQTPSARKCARRLPIDYAAAMRSHHYSPFFAPSLPNRTCAD